MEIGISIIIGVFTGILSAMVVGAVNIMYKYIILPWFQVKVYKGVLLEGCWNGFMQIGTAKWDMKLIINQKGSKVSGDLTAKSNDPNAKKKETTMTFEGNIYDGYLIISCIAKDPHDISFGAMILRIKNKRMTGRQIFRDLSESKYDVFGSNVEFEYE